MTHLRMWPALGLALIAGVATAHPGFDKTVKSVYKPAATSPVVTKACALCHMGYTPKLNPFGADLKKAMASAKTKTLTPAVLKKVATLDSDKDGAKNGVELKAGTLPGDPTSKPAAKKPGKK